jgi:hypothetical protein
VVPGSFEVKVTVVALLNQPFKPSGLAGFVDKLVVGGVASISRVILAPPVSLFWNILPAVTEEIFPVTAVPVAVGATLNTMIYWFGLASTPIFKPEKTAFEPDSEPVPISISPESQSFATEPLSSKRRTLATFVELNAALPAKVSPVTVSMLPIV